MPEGPGFRSIELDVEFHSSRRFRCQRCIEGEKQSELASGIRVRAVFGNYWRANSAGIENTNATLILDDDAEQRVTEDNG